ncbi:MAG: efflux RND transporter periplasmic adaptor subunit [Desulfatiglandaceae bacterium]
MKQLLQMGLALLMSVALLCWGGCNKKDQNKKKTKGAASLTGHGHVLPVKAVQATRTPHSYHLKFPGVVRAAVESDLSFRVPGLIVALPINIGQVVKKGDLIARLDMSDYQDAVDQARDDRDRAKARLQDEQKHYARVRKLWADQDVSTSQLDAARTAARTAEEELRIASKRLSEAKRRLNHAELVAPYDGIIADKHVHAFQRVGVGQSVALLVDPSSTQLRAQLPTSLIPKKGRFTQFQCSFPGLGDLTLKAKLEGIGPSALPPIRTFPITVTLSPPADLPILPGTEGILNITVTNPHPPDEVFVPASAIVGAPKGKSRVWVVDRKSGKVRPQPVVIEGLHNGKIACKSGVQAGEWVITAGHSRLTPGLEVHIVKPPSRDG